MTKEPVSLSDWIHFLSTLINVSNTIIFGTTSIVILIAVSLYLFVDWAKAVILVVVFVLIFVIYWFMYGRNSPYTKARVLLKEIMYGKKNDPEIIQKEWCDGVRNMDENKNIFNYVLWIVVGIIIGILIGISLCLLINSGILSKISFEVFLPQFLGSFFALLIALFIFWLGQYYSKKREESRQVQLMRNLTSMIKDEIEFNIKKNEQMRKEAKKGLLPNYRLKNDNKNACWTKIVEYRHTEVSLINSISELYYKYELLNRTIDVGFQYMFSKIPIKGLHQEIERICNRIEEKSKEILDKI